MSDQEYVSRFLEHFEWLGYEDDKKGDLHIMSKNGESFVFACSSDESSYAVILMHYQVDAKIFKANTQEALEMVNKINLDYETMKVYFTDEKEKGNMSLHFLFLYCGDYSKKRFSSFVERAQATFTLASQEHKDTISKVCL